MTGWTTITAVGFGYDSAGEKTGINFDTEPGYFDPEGMFQNDLFDHSVESAR